MMAVNVPRREGERDAVERAHRAVSAPEDAHDVFELDHPAGGGAVCCGSPLGLRCRGS